MVDSMIAVIAPQICPTSKGCQPDAPLWAAFVGKAMALVSILRRASYGTRANQLKPVKVTKYVREGKGRVGKDHSLNDLDQRSRSLHWSKYLQSNLHKEHGEFLKIKIMIGDFTDQDQRSRSFPTLSCGILHASKPNACAISEFRELWKWDKSARCHRKTTPYDPPYMTSEIPPEFKDHFHSLMHISLKLFMWIWPASCLLPPAYLLYRKKGVVSEIQIICGCRIWETPSPASQAGDSAINSGPRTGPDQNTTNEWRRRRKEKIPPSGALVARPLLTCP